MAILWRQIMMLILKWLKSKTKILFKDVGGGVEERQTNRLTWKFQSKNSKRKFLSSFSQICFKKYLWRRIVWQISHHTKLDHGYVQCTSIRSLKSLVFPQKTKQKANNVNMLSLFSYLVVHFECCKSYLAAHAAKSKN